jgi:hypothetical protein
MEILKQKLNNEMTEFKKSYETMTPTQIYNDWYIICFYESYYEMLIHYTQVNEIQDILDWLNTYENPLGFLYSEWLSCDRAFCGLWDDMISWIQDLKCDVEENSYEEEYYPSSTNGDYSPSNPWDAPGMSVRDFI